jgi:hypothetical protein
MIGKMKEREKIQTNSPIPARPFTDPLDLPRSGLPDTYIKRPDQTEPQNRQAKEEEEKERRRGRKEETKKRKETPRSF